MAVPYTFGSATSSIPLSQLDSNFATGITLGNTTVYLGNTTTSFGNVTLTNVTISSVSTAITPSQGGTGLVTIPANNVILGNGTSNVTVVAPGTSGNVLTSNGTTWSSSTISAASVSAAGSTTQVQYNNGGAFAGSANLTFNGTTLTAAGLSGPLNGTVGATTPSTGAFTTLSASSTVSGTGFSTYLASPPAIGGTAAAAGSFTTLSASSDLTLSGGTANGVTYLNGSKVLTSGSALTFDGTYFGVGSGNSSMKVGADGANNFQIFNGALTPDGTNFALEQNYLGTNTVLNAASGGQLLFRIGNSNNAVLTSTGLGIGTSSPGASTKLNVAGRGLFTGGAADPSDSTSAGVAINYNGTTGFIGAIQTGVAVKPLFVYGNNLIFGGSPTAEFMRLDSAGNLGLGVTPSASWANYKVLQIGEQGVISGYASGAGVLNTGANFYWDGSGYRYLTTNPASLYQQNAGAHNWRIAASGTAGTNISFTQAMTLSASGGLSIGTTTDANAKNLLLDAGGKLAGNAPSGGTSSTIELYNASTGNMNLTAAYSAASITFATGGTTERARIDSSGNLCVGHTAAGVTNTKSIIADVGGDGYLIVNHTGTSSGSVFEYFGYNGGVIGSITQSGTTAVLYNVTSDQRLKENIQDADSASSLIDSLQVRKFDWKADGTHQRYGFVAQELVTVAPEAVHQPTDTEEMMAVDYSKLVPMLVKEIQSLRQRLAAANI